MLTYAGSPALSEVDLDEGDIEELHGYFEKSEIDLVEDDPTHSGLRSSVPSTGARGARRPRSTSSRT